MSFSLMPRRLINSSKKSIRLQKECVRNLSLHEHFSQDILKQYGVPVPQGRVASSVSKVREIAMESDGPWVLKSQILAGGRGKGIFDHDKGKGIRVTNSVEEARTVAGNMLGHRLVTKQTDAHGMMVKKLYVTEQVKFQDEYYLAMTVDRATYSPVLILSKQGGVNIEAISKSQPDQLHKFWFKMSSGITTDMIAEIKKQMDFTQHESDSIADILKKLYKIFLEKDATLLEINPLVRTEEGKFICLDAKFNFDNAAEERQKDLFALRDKEQELSDELEAEKHGLVYVRLDGNIGNVVNGAGLAMATNDAVELYGGKSANFLDAGGKATVETMLAAFKIILGDTRVKVILVNIYGGITRCDMIAKSIVAAAAELGASKLPIVVRLQGTNSEAGLDLIAKSGLGLYTESEFGDAAKKAVELAAA